MAYDYRLLIPGTVLEVSFRTQNGLPLVANALIRHIIESILAAAQNQYGQVICDFVVMGNHIHMILLVRDSRSLVAFIEYVKRELAIAINKLLGRRQQTVWTSGYNPAVILDTAKLIERKVYIYTNPQNAHLVDTIEDYPGLNSWDAFKNGGCTKTLNRIPRSAIPTLPKKRLTNSQIDKILHTMCAKAHEELELRIEPDAWISGIPDGTEQDPENIRDDIIAQVREIEAILSAELSKTRRHVKGRKALIQERMDQYHIPKKFSRRVICYASDIKIRISFITWFKSECQYTWNLVRQDTCGTFRAKRPPGFFSPGGFLASNLNPHLLQDVLLGAY
jgi:REP element-mobilizing transposase RayT